MLDERVCLKHVCLPVPPIPRGMNRRFAAQPLPIARTYGTRAAVIPWSHTWGGDRRGPSLPNLTRGLAEWTMVDRQGFEP
jgi:hypothetical protein